MERDYLVGALKPKKPLGVSGPVPYMRNPLTGNFSDRPTSFTLTQFAKSVAARFTPSPIMPLAAKPPLDLVKTAAEPSLIAEQGEWWLGGRHAERLAGSQGRLKALY
jgi:hypothetical protein